MLISLKANNFQIYNSEIAFTMKADLHHKHFSSSYISHGKNGILKSAILIGPNNSGKSNFVHAILTLKKIMLNQAVVIQPNLFTNSSVCMLSVSFLSDSNEYLFELKYDADHKEYIYERFAQIFYDQYNNRKEDTLLLRDIPNAKYECKDKSLVPIMNVAARNNILIHLIDSSRFPVLDHIKRVIAAFASELDIIDMNNIPIQKTVRILKEQNGLCGKVSRFIQNAGIYIDDYRYSKTLPSDADTPQESALSAENSLMELLHLVSEYNGFSVSSIALDSTGAKKVIALAGYIVDAIENHRILVVDELDNSLHCKLTRAVITLFNNELNTGAQLITTVNDISLLDCKTLFRRDQIWFSNRDRENVYLYSLSDFTSQKDNIRNTTDLIERYRQGAFGILPDPDLFSAVYGV